MENRGLGIPNALEMTYLGKVRLAERMSNSKDENVRLVYDTGCWGSELSAFEQHLSRQRGLDRGSWRTSLSNYRWQQWCKFAQGRGAKAFVGQRNNWWLREGDLTGRIVEDLFFASKLGSRTLACGESMTRGRGKSIPPCGACGGDKKMVSHILQSCPTTSGLRIPRHNIVMDVVKRRLKKADMWCVANQES